MSWPTRQASRFTELRAYLEVELRKVGEEATDARSATAAKLDEVKQEIIARLSEVGNGLAAHVAELEDKIDRELKTGA